jgi:hypothetical protein
MDFSVRVLGPRRMVLHAELLSGSDSRSTSTSRSAISRQRWQRRKCAGRPGSGRPALCCPLMLRLLFNFGVHLAMEQESDEEIQQCEDC